MRFRVLCAGMVTFMLCWCVTARPAAAYDRLCDPSFEDCRAALLDLIKHETQGIDVAFWFMEDARYLNAIVARWKAGVPVRLLVSSSEDSKRLPSRPPLFLLYASLLI